MASDNKPVAPKVVEKVEDTRLDYLSSHIIRSMRIKLDKWIKLLSSREYKVRNYFLKLCNNILIFKFF